jgi:uncharacterized protein
MSSMFRDFGAGLAAFEAPLDARLAFIRRTYLHVTGAVLGFAAVCTLFQVSGFNEGVYRWLVNGGKMNALLLCGGLVLIGWMARGLARSTNSVGLQYAGLAGYVAAQALIFAPAIYAASEMGPHILPTAAGLSALAFGALSTFVITTKKDFSFLGPVLFVAALVALGTIVVGMFAGFNLGIWFSAAMIVFAVGAILYDTSKVLHDYRTDQHVAASLELFASVALLFFYVLRLLMQLQRRN